MLTSSILKILSIHWRWRKVILLWISEVLYCCSSIRLLGNIMSSQMSSWWASHPASPPGSQTHPGSPHQSSTFPPYLLQSCGPPTFCFSTLVSNIRLLRVHTNIRLLCVDHQHHASLTWQAELRILSWSPSDSSSFNGKQKLKKEHLQGAETVPDCFSGVYRKKSKQSFLLGPWQFHYYSIC